MEKIMMGGACSKLRGRKLLPDRYVKKRLVCVCVCVYENNRDTERNED
jgi:hypothetical protein